VLANANVREKEGRGLTDIRSTRRANGSEVTMFQKV